MMHPVLTGVCRMLMALMVAWLLAPGSARAQTYTPPRTPDGQPIAARNLEFAGRLPQQPGGGAERLRPEAPGRRDIRAMASGKRVPVRRPRYKSPIVDPPNGKIPYQPWAVAKRDDNYAHFLDPKGQLQYVDPVARCLPAGRAAYELHVDWLVSIPAAARTRAHSVGVEPSLSHYSARRSSSCWEETSASGWVTPVAVGRAIRSWST